MADKPLADEPLSRPDWRESLALAADLALLGIVIFLVTLPVVTAGAAVATASSAVHHLCRNRTLPSVRDMAGTFVRALLPGLGAVAALAVAILLLSLDLRVLSSGQVPGGTPLTVVTWLLIAAAAALCLLCVVRVGTTGGRGWLAAVAWSARLLANRPHIGLLLLVVAALPTLLASAIPVTAPLLVGFGLFALHVIVRRTAG